MHATVSNLPAKCSSEKTIDVMAFCAVCRNIEEREECLFFHKIHAARAFRIKDDNIICKFT